MKEYLGKRILFSLGDNDAVRQSCVQALSPNGLYVRIEGDTVWDEYVGWAPVRLVAVHDVLGDEAEPLSKIKQRSYALQCQSDH